MPRRADKPLSRGLLSVFHRTCRAKTLSPKAGLIGQRDEPRVEGKRLLMRGGANPPPLAYFQTAFARTAADIHSTIQDVRPYQYGSGAPQMRCARRNSRVRARQINVSTGRCRCHLRISNQVGDDMPDQKKRGPNAPSKVNAALTRAARPRLRRG